MKLQVSVMVCVVLEKSGGCLAQIEYSSHQLIKKEEGYLCHVSAGGLSH